MRMSKLLIIFGAILILVGLLYPYLSRIGLGKLPGDLQFKMGDSFFLFSNHHIYCTKHFPNFNSKIFYQIKK